MAVLIVSQHAQLLTAKRMKRKLPGFLKLIEQLQQSPLRALAKTLKSSWLEPIKTSLAATDHFLKGSVFAMPAPLSFNSLIELAQQIRELAHARIATRLSCVRCH